MPKGLFDILSQCFFRWKGRRRWGEVLLSECVRDSSEDGISGADGQDRAGLIVPTVKSVGWFEDGRHFVSFGLREWRLDVGGESDGKREGVGRREREKGRNGNYWVLMTVRPTKASSRTHGYHHYHHNHHDDDY